MMQHQTWLFRSQPLKRIRSSHSGKKTPKQQLNRSWQCQKKKRNHSMAVYGRTEILRVFCWRKRGIKNAHWFTRTFTNITHFVPFFGAILNTELIKNWKELEERNDEKPKHIFRGGHDLIFLHWFTLQMILMLHFLHQWLLFGCTIRYGRLFFSATNKNLYIKQFFGLPVRVECAQTNR